MIHSEYNGSRLTAHGHLSINFFCNWNKHNRLTSWSGTHYSLFNSLSELANVIDVPLMNNFCLFSLKRINSLMYKLAGKNNFMMFETKLCEHEIRAMHPDKNFPCLMFTEYITEYTPQSYLYQDLTVDFIFRMREAASSISKFTPLPPNVSNKIAKARRERTMLVNKTCAGLFTMSEYLAKDLVENSGIPASKVHHVGGGCNIDVSMINSSKKNGRRFLFVGRDWERKNGPLVVEALRKIRKKYSDVELYIIGPAKIPETLNDSENINFLGPLNYSETAEYFNLCDFFVMPSKFEAYGLVFPEALIFGLPCIGKNLCAMPEFIQDGLNGALIDNDDPDELADCMERVLLDRNNLAAYVQKMHDEYLRKYSWRSVAERIVKVMKEDGF